MYLQPEKCLRNKDKRRHGTCRQRQKPKQTNKWSMIQNRWSVIKQRKFKVNSIQRNKCTISLGYCEGICDLRFVIRDLWSAMFLDLNGWILQGGNGNKCVRSAKETVCEATHLVEVKRKTVTREDKTRIERDRERAREKGHKRQRIWAE